MRAKGKDIMHQQAAEKLLRLVSRINQLQGVFEEIEAKQRERVIEQGATDLAHHLQGNANAYGDVARSLRQVLHGEKSIFHLSAAAEHLYIDSDPENHEEPWEAIEQGLSEGLGQST